MTLKCGWTAKSSAHSAAIAIVCSEKAWNNASKKALPFESPRPKPRPPLLQLWRGGDMVVIRFACDLQASISEASLMHPHNPSCLVGLHALSPVSGSWRCFDPCFTSQIDMIKGSRSTKISCPKHTSWVLSIHRMAWLHPPKPPAEHVQEVPREGRVKLRPETDLCNVEGKVMAAQTR